MKVIIAGSRHIEGELADKLVADAIADSGWKPTEVVSGFCRGIDHAGERWAEVNGIPVRRFPADWDTHGKAAGPIRNREMAAYADALIAIPQPGSRGTANMVDEMNRLKKPVCVIVDSKEFAR